MALLRNRCYAGTKLTELKALSFEPKRRSAPTLTNKLVYTRTYATNHPGPLAASVPLVEPPLRAGPHTRSESSDPVPPPPPFERWCRGAVCPHAKMATRGGARAS
jgi:hypothetical protein